METDVAVIGGGLAGLSCALALADAGFRVTVLERNSNAGGRAGSLLDAATGDVIDLGPHILLSEYRNMLQLLERAGTRERVRWQTGKFVTLVGDNGRWNEMHAWRLPAPLHFLPSLLKVPAISATDLLSNRRVLWLALKLGRRGTLQLDRMNAAELLRRLGVTERFTDWYWRTVCMVIMNVPLEECSAGALLRFFSEMVGHSGYRIGFPAVSLDDLTVAPVVRAIERGGGRLLFRAAVKRIRQEKRAAAGVILEDGTEMKAGACVACVPPQALEPMLPPEWKDAYSLFRKLDRFQPVPYVSTYLWLSRKVTRELFWARTWSPDSFCYDSYDLSNIRSGWAARPSLVATNVIDSSGERQGDEELIDRTLEDLRVALPSLAKHDIEHARVNRVPMAIHAPHPGTERLRPQTRTPVRGLFLAGDWIGTGLPASMESAVCAGYRAAERAAQHLGRELRIALPVRPRQGIARVVQRLGGD